jgi:hypothetical protein
MNININNTRNSNTNINNKKALDKDKKSSDIPYIGVVN